MIPQSSEIINTQYFQSLIDEINSCPSCSQLQTLATDSLTAIAQQQDAVIEQQALLEPMLSLLTAPTNPTAAVTWIQNFITNYLDPQLKPAVNYVEQTTALIAQVTELTTAITDAASKFESCSITIPPLPSPL